MRPHDPISAELHSASTRIVTLRGEHDLASVPEVRTALAMGSRRQNVIVDLSHCTFVDSTVISALLQASNKLHARGGQLLLVIPAGSHRAVRVVFELMSLERLMPTYETRAAAIRHLETAASATTLPTTRLRALSEIIDFSLSETDEHRRAA